jgi:hypothetical protein
MNNVSTLNFRRVIPEMASSVGISKSSVNRQFIPESALEIKGVDQGHMQIPPPGMGEPPGVV